MQPNYESGWRREENGDYSFHNMPQEEYQRPAPEPVYEQSRNTPQSAYTATDYDTTEPTYEEPRHQPATDEKQTATPDQSPYENTQPSYPETTGTEQHHIITETNRTETADAAANAQLDDQHYEREESERIVRAIERASSELRQETTETTNPSATATGGSNEIVHVPRTPGNDIYFNPHIDTETQTRFNQHIFVPNNEPAYEYHDEQTNSDHYQEAIRGEN